MQVLPAGDGAGAGTRVRVEAGEEPSDPVKPRRGHAMSSPEVDGAGRCDGRGVVLEIGLALPFLLFE